MSKYVTDEAMRSAMTLQKGYIDQGDNTNAEGIDSLKAGKNLLSGVITGFDWRSSVEAAFAPMTHAIEIKDGVFSIKEAGDNYIVSPFVNVEDGKTYTFSFFYINGGGYEIYIVGSANNHVFQASGGGPISCSFTSVATETVRILVKTDDKKLKNPQLELGSKISQFTASTEDLKDYIDNGDKANAEGIEALRKGKNMLPFVLTGGVYHAGGWGSSAEASQNPTLHALDVTDGVFSIKEAGDNYIVSPFVNVEDGKTYTFSFLYINGGQYEINIIGGQNIYQTQGATGGTISFTFTSVATESVRIFVSTSDKKLAQPQLELGSSYTEFTASTEELKKYHDNDTNQTQLITTPPATLNAQVGYYYCMGGNGVVVDTMTIQLPAIEDKNKTNNVQFFMTMGSAPEVTFVSAGTERIRYQKDFALEAGKGYEVNALWNGHAWVITVVEIIVPFFAKLSLNNGEVVKLQGSGELTSAMISPYKSTVVSAEIGELCTSIGNWAFYSCKGLTSITIPDSVTSIDDQAFNSCTGLISITIPDSIISIGDFAFSNCEGLTSVSIPDSVTSIGVYAFNSCTSLTSISIPNSVTSIGDSAFYGCEGLTSIVVNSANTVFDSRDNCNAIIKTSTNELIVGCKNTVIPDSVTTIGDSAFSGCSGLTSVTIGSGVTSIGGSAFYSCKGLTSITIPDSVTTIGDSAFSGCSGLTSVTIGSGVTYIGDGVFTGCSVLTNIVVDSANTVYDSRDNCNAIIKKSTNELIAGCKNTVIPNTVTSIGRDAFNGCTGLTSITIPDSVTSIGDMAFGNCENLTSITSLAATAPTIEWGTFDRVKRNGTLRVPSGSTGYDEWMNYLDMYNWNMVEQ